MLANRTRDRIGRRAKHSFPSWRSISPRYGSVNYEVARARLQKTQTRGKKTRTSMKLEDLPQGPIKPVQPPPPEPEPDEGPVYPTVVQQARRNMAKFENCVLLTRVGGFYELYFEHAEEYGPALNLKVARKKTSAGPVPMAGFPFFQLDRFLKTLVSDMNCYVAIAEEFPNDAGDRVKSNGLMHDRRVARVITPGTLIDENFIDPYANNYVMAVHAGHSHETKAPGSGELEIPNSTDSGRLAELQENTAPIGLAWIDVSTGQFYTQSTTITSLGSILSRVGPREIVVDDLLESQKDHQLFSVLAEDKHLITFAPQGEHLPLSEWGPMLESDIPAQTAQTFTTDEVQAGSLLLQYVRDRLQGLSMKLQPPQRYENTSVMSIDKSTMRALEIKQTIRDGVFRGSLLHAVRRTVTKGGARLLNAWLSAPSTNLETIRSRHDLVEHFIQYPDLRDDIVLLLRRSHDSQRLVQKFALGRGDPDDLIALASTIRATQDIVSLLESAESHSHTNTSEPKPNPSSTSEGTPCFTSLLSRIQLEEPTKLADRIKSSIDEEGLVQQHQAEDSEANQLITLAEDIVASEGAREDATSVLPKSSTTAAAKRKRQQSATTSIRDHYSGATDDNAPFVMKPEASPALRALHDDLASLLHEKEALAETLRERFGGAASLTLRWSPNLGHVCHIKGARDLRKLGDASNVNINTVSSSRSTRTFHVPEWTRLGQRLRQARFEIGAEEQRLFGALRARVVANLVKLRRNAQVLDELDVAASSARLAAELGWTRPVLHDDTTGTGENSQHVIIGGRHPTVEGGLREQGRSFTQNDCLVGTAGAGRLWLITGPNMGGKSTYLRQNALISILAQAGSYVPADHASLGVIDAVYSRVGSADDLFADQSTFMVEMLETARILREATPRSLVIMDEVGRGTTPDDGAAVAFAALHHLVAVNRCRALFATHFHGLADLVAQRGMHVAQGGAVEMYCTDVEEVRGGGFVYVHKLQKGINRQSHALKVARLANMPEAAITVAREILEKNNHHQNYNENKEASSQNDTHANQSASVG
ncbi:muts domain V-domain-containing protein [Hypoxylon rubiginosum]|uniref:Muts domain V-domain-containing protein n=1 Tax=Hypoxylon rubiginosum TaxID=110542 RepID=A0ACC0DMK9_9PEZI|nr:muts domain V-domain-containing protein [Hypoxylon rubiginosum]